MRTRKIWTTQENEYMRTHYPHESSVKVAEALGRSVKSIYSQANLLGLKKSEEFLKTAQCGRIVKGMVIGKETWFKKGQIPQNKGKKQHEYMTAEGIARSSNTRFKKGNKPQNYKPVGSERITSYGYTEVKIEDPNKWKPKHKIIYESHYNCTIPKGHKCIFIDGDKTNFDISNLIVEAPAVAIRRNTINRYSAELKSLIRLHKSLIKTISKNEK